MRTRGQIVQISELESRRLPCDGRAGFTLLEMLTVLGILAVLLGLSVGVFSSNVPRLTLAKNELRDKVRQARLFAVAENAPASVLLRAGSETDWPEVTALGRRTVGTWHLEGTDLDGFPVEGQGSGYEEEARGVIGRAVRLSGQMPSFLDFGTRAAFDSVYGFAVQLYVRLDGPSRRVLVRKGEAFELEVNGEGSLALSLRVVEPGRTGSSAQVFESIESPAGAVRPDRWTEVMASFDGLQLELRVDGATVASHRLLDWRRLAVDEAAPLTVGDRTAAFSGSVDEFRYGTYGAETSEPLRDMVLDGPELQTIRFAPGGELDPRVHEGPVTVRMHHENGAPLRVRVGVLGDVR